MAKKKRRRSLRGSEDRYVVSGPATWRRSLHSSKAAAMDRAKECSKKHPNAVCRVTYGLPGLQNTIAECNRSECWTADGGVGRRKRRSRKGRR